MTPQTLEQAIEVEVQEFLAQICYCGDPCKGHSEADELRQSLHRIAILTADKLKVKKRKSSKKIIGLIPSCITCSYPWIACQCRGFNSCISAIQEKRDKFFGV